MRHIRLMIKGYREDAEREAFNRGIPFEFLAEVLDWITILKVPMAYQPCVMEWYFEKCSDTIYYPTGTLLYFAYIEDNKP